MNPKPDWPPTSSRCNGLVNGDEDVGERGQESHRRLHFAEPALEEPAFAVMGDQFERSPVTLARFM
jgi:hypothetical protein